MKTRLISLCIFILLRAESHAQVCSDPANVIYGLTSTGNIRPVHVATGLADPAINPPLTGLGYPPSSNGMGYNPVNGNFYYFDIFEPGNFVSYNPATNQTTNLSPMPSIYYAGVLSACVNNTGTGYYCLDAGWVLFYYNIAADSWTLVDSVMVDQNGNNVTSQFKHMYGGDMAMDGTGNLWMVTASDSTYALYVAEGPLPTTYVSQLPVMQLIPETTLYEDGGSVDGIAFDPVGNIYLSTNSDLYELQSGTTTITHIGSFGLDTTSEVMEDLTSCNFPGTEILGLPYTGFTASLQANRTVLLNWQYGQVAGTGFSIQHSPDGQQWSAIGYQAVDGASPSTGYSWLDTHPFDGKNWYRIIMENPASTGYYSPIRVVDVTAATAITISPNPVKDALYMQYDGRGGSAKATIYDPTGRLLEEIFLSAGSTAVSMAGWPSGIYIVSVQFGDGRSYPQKVLKQ
jgi:hypothetical protein